MTPSLNKCPRCGTLRPSGEVAHTCVVRSTVPDHEAAQNWAEQIPKQATVSVDDENLSRAYLDLVARDPADTGTSREGDPYAEIAALRAELQRKDAALRKYADSANYSNGYYGEVTWCGAMDGEEDAPWNIARAALHPKEPPCKA